MVDKPEEIGGKLCKTQVSDGKDGRLEGLQVHLKER